MGVRMTPRKRNRIFRITVVADQGHKLVDAVAVLHAGAGEHGEDVAVPTTIIVDKRGVVRALFRPTSVARRLSAREVLAIVDNEWASNR